MATDGVSQVKAVLSPGSGDTDEGLALVTSWLRGVESAQSSLQSVGKSMAATEEEFLDRPAVQAFGWLSQLSERLDFVARKLRSGQS